MIARTWTGATRAGDADRYLEYLRRTGLSEYAATPGNEGILALRRMDGDHAEFTIVTLWRDARAIEGFAGGDVKRAVFYPEDETYLVRRDESAEHHEVVFSGPEAQAKPPRRAGVLERFVGWWARVAAPALPGMEASQLRQLRQQKR